MKCPICLSEKNEQVFKKLSHSITSDSEMIDKEVSNVICFTCGNVFNESGPRNTICHFYSDSYKLMNLSSEAESRFYSKNDSISHSDWRLDVLLDNISIPDAGSILDIGCGKGNFLVQFSKRHPKWLLSGVEVSKNALKFAKDKLPQADLREGIFVKDFFDKKFDIIVALDVFEHLEDPVTFLEMAICNLTESGIIFLEVPNFKINPADLFVYDHLTHFTKETLTNLLNRAEAEVIKVIENRDRLPLFAICRKATNKTPIQNHYILMKKLIEDHIKFNDTIFKTYREADSKYDSIGVFGLGILVWAGIQNSILSKEKIASFFDENHFLIGQKKLGIEVRDLHDVKKFQNLPIVLSLSPCYIENIIHKLAKSKAKCISPEGYQYYKKYFLN